MIPFKKLVLPTDTKDQVAALLDSGMIGLGNEVFEFEKSLAHFVGSKYVIAVDSCTSALMLSLRWQYLQEGKTKIQIPSMTVPLVPAAAIEAGHDIEFTDHIDWVGSAYLLGNSPVIDSAHELEKDSFNVITERLNVPKDKAKVCFSFYPTKNIGSADGGAIATNDDEFAQWARSISTYGRNQKDKYQNSWDYDIEIVGYKRHYTNLQAVICHIQLDWLPERNTERARIRDTFNSAFGFNNKSLYLYRIKVENRDKFIAYMNDKGIQCGVHFKPLHLMHAYQKTEFAPGSHRTVVENEYGYTVSLPFWYGMGDLDIAEIIEAVKQSPYKIAR